MPVSRQRQVQIDQRRRQVAELTLKGHRQSEIAAQLEVTQSTVSKDLQQVRAAWREAGVRDFEAAVSEQLETLALIQREAWLAWERSKQPAHTAVIQGADDEQRTRQTLKHRYGDPRLLQQVQRCLDRSRHLLGLDAALRRAAEAPAKKEITFQDMLEHIANNPGPPPYSNVVDGAEEYERIMQERERELERQERERCD
ncbi:MAG TPA: ECF-type sigma factor [Pirellulales bacterium]|nr:ECF-type sigma factor [Pirellulales bacterium]